MKRKTLTLVLCLLATFALASIGFASWIIANPDITTDGTTSGQFTVYEAVSSTMDAEVSFVGGKNTFVFGKPTGYSADSTKWLTAGADVADESLSVSMDITITNANLLNGGSVDVIIYVENDKLVTAMTNGLLTCEVNNSASTFTETQVKVGSVTKDVYAISTTLTPSIESGETDGTLTVTLEFGWGSTFGSLNPYEYYNGMNYDDQIGQQSAAEHADANLNALDTALTDLAFNVKIVKTPAQGE